MARPLSTGEAIDDYLGEWKRFGAGTQHPMVETTMGNKMHEDVRGSSMNYSWSGARANLQELEPVKSKKMH